MLSGCEVDAVDPLLERYRELAHFDPERQPWVQWHTGTLEAYAPAAPYDYVFCLNVINHVRDLGRALEVLAEALRPTGTLVLSVDAHRYAWLKPLFRAIPGDALHPHQFDLAEYEALCRARGLHVERRLRYKRETIFDYWILVLKLDA